MWNKRRAPKTTELFAPISSISRSPFYECDMNIHKSNSSYSSDLDIARTHLFAHLIKKSLAKHHRAGKPLYVALAGVNILFRKEIKPFEKYQIDTRVLAWDEKWFWVVSHFVEVDGAKSKRKTGSNGSAVASSPLGDRKIFASCLSKYVFKSGRITVRPEVVLRESGLLPDRPEGSSGLASGTSSPPAVGPNSGPGAGTWEPPKPAASLPEGEWTWERIEAERLRGLQVARQMLALDSLDQEFIGSGTSPGGIGVF